MSKYHTVSFWVKPGEGRNFIGVKITDPCVPDLDDFNASLTAAFERLDQNGYDPIQVVPLQVGGPATNDKKQFIAITRGAAVVGRRRE